MITLKKIKLIFTLFSLALFFDTRAQSSINTIYSSLYSDTLSNKYLKLQDVTQKEVYERLKKSNFNASDDLYRSLSQGTGSFIYQNLTTGAVITNWPSANDYLEAILYKILPDSLKKAKFNIIITNDPTCNASSDLSNTIYVTLGLLAEAKNESEIALILAHELGHYLKFHVLKSQLNAPKSTSWLALLPVLLISPRLAGSIIESDRITQNLFSQDMEVEADSIALNLMLKSKYSLRKGKRIFESFELEQLIFDNTGKISIYETTHPQNEDREFKIHQASTKEIHAKEFQVGDSTMFNNIRLKATQVRAFIYLSTGEYQNSAYLSFMEILKNPYNKEHFYILLESLRRVMYINNKAKNYTFIFDSPIIPDKKFHFFNSYLRSMIPLSLNEIHPILQEKLFSKTRSISFSTNLEAFEYFYLLSQDFECTECMLSKGLFEYIENKRFENQYFQSYRKKPDADQIQYLNMMSNVYAYSKNATIGYMVDLYTSTKENADIDTDSLSNIGEVADTIQEEAFKSYKSENFKILSMNNTMHKNYRVYCEFLPFFQRKSIIDNNITYNESMLMNEINHNKAYANVKWYYCDPYLASIFIKYNIKEFKYLYTQLLVKAKNSNFDRENVKAIFKTNRISFSLPYNDAPAYLENKNKVVLSNLTDELKYQIKYQIQKSDY